MVSQIKAAEHQSIEIIKERSEPSKEDAAFANLLPKVETKVKGVIFDVEREGGIDFDREGEWIERK